ncbi:calcium-translocating P-type ATPase, SERCA-type [Nanoarchaeota archaeon]
MLDKEIKEVYEFLGSSADGLPSGEAEARIGKYGYNEFQHNDKVSKLSILLRQFKSTIVMILVFATIVSGFLGEWLDAGAIFTILLLNAVLGFTQEYKAEKAIDALKKLAAPKARVIRDGKIIYVESRLVVPGDILVLETGDRIPADARVIESSALETQESILTGESLPVRKHNRALDSELPLGDRKNMVFQGTIVTKGNGRAVVVATAMQTEMGKIAGMIQEADDQMTPLQEKLGKLGQWIGMLTLVVCGIVFAVGVWGGQEPLDMFIVAVSLAVAAIPEGLPAVITISLSFGVQRMLKRNALMRKLSSVQTLGSTTVICTDKTGTLTHNEMTVRKVFVDNTVLEVTGTGYNPEGEVIGRFDPMLFEIGALCNESTLIEESWTVTGDPTEACLLTSARKAGLLEKDLQDRHPRIGVVPFDSVRKRMTTIHKLYGKTLAYTKGAPDLLLELCTKKLVNGQVTDMTQEDKEKVLKVTQGFSDNALRVLGFAYREIEEKEEEEYSEQDETDLIFVGLQGMIDPPRQEVQEAIQKCRTAGIKVLMVTGDHKGTALAIAKELGIEGNAVDGKELDALDLDKDIDDIGIFARVSPEHKVKIVEALKRKGHIVAMTGDGVNDAPALKQADIGISMGISGTDVAQEASEMVLTDDNFTSIVNAVEEGRGIYDNIKKFVNYLLSSNFGEVLVLFVALLIGFKGADGSIIVPLLALQILWINLITDSLPALALGVDPVEDDIMLRKPRNPQQGIISRNMALNILVIGTLMCAATLYLFNLGLPDVDRARTLALTTLVVMEIVRLHMIRQSYHTSILGNKWLIWAVLAVLALQIIAIYTPLSQILGLVAIEWMDWVYILIVCAGMFAIGVVASHFIKVLTHERD